MVALPMTAMAMTSVSDSELAGVTGQAGVVMNIDVTADVSIGTMAWGDTDGAQFVTGVTGSTLNYMSTSGGYVGLTGMNFTVAMHPRTDVPLEQLGFITIDVAGNAPVKSYVKNATTGASQLTTGFAAAVKIGLPTAEILVSSLTTDVFMSGIVNGAPGTPEVLGHVYMSGIQILLGQASGLGFYDGGYVLISAIPGGKGVRMDLQPKIGAINIDTMSWGNDGLAGTYGDNLSGAVSDITNTGAGFIGVRNFKLGAVAVNGAIEISVGQSSLINYVYSNFLSRRQMAATGTPVPLPLVQILFEDGFKFSAGPITGDVVLSTQQNLTATAGSFNTATMGNFYIGGFAVTMRDNAARTQALNHGGATTYVVPAHPSVIQITAH
jgi:hypothetical protein